MWSDEIGFWTWVLHAFASALAVLAFIGAIAMWTYDPAVTVEARALFEGLRP